MLLAYTRTVKRRFYQAESTVTFNMYVVNKVRTINLHGEVMSDSGISVCLHAESAKLIVFQQTFISEGFTLNTCQAIVTS
jgi:hypothetical protein